MPGFIRRFLDDPGEEVLLEIEGVVIIDREPPATPLGVGTGTVLLVGEFEDGPFEQSEVTSGEDLQRRFGSFGYSYDGVVANNPSARARRADSALVDEHWNGNGIVWLSNKSFARLILLRVDTSVGEVEFTRLACLSGADTPTFDLDDGQTLTVDADSLGPWTATFTGAVAELSSAAGTYPTTFTGGEKMTVVIDEGTPLQVGPVDIVFTADDQDQVDVIARVNQVLGYTAAVDGGGDTTDLLGRVKGTAGKAEILAIDTAVATATGWAVGSDAGSGNVAFLGQTTVAEVDAVLDAATTSRVTADRDASGRLRICNVTSPGQILEYDGASTALALGFGTADVTVDAADGEASVIPAGTRVRNGAAVEWVTMQAVNVEADNAGPYSVKVRHALDDGSGLTTVANSVDVIPFPIAAGGFKVTNPSALDPALTEAQLDVKYVEAIQSTKSLTAVGAQANLIGSARMSNLIRSALRTNVIEASSEGAFGRMTAIRPPLGTTTRDVATGTTQPGVGATRDRRVVYCYPGTSTVITAIAARGTAGGAGFTADGRIDVGWDSFAISIMSRLPPEENPGQETDFALGALSLELGNPDVVDLRIGDYKLFRRSGIAAPRLSKSGKMVIQSGVTSVDPLLSPQLRNIARQRMSDFITDSLALNVLPKVKKLSTRTRRAALVSSVRAFQRGLLDDERIDAFSVVPSTDQGEIRKGIFRIRTKTRTLASLDVIVIDSTVGEEVATAEEAAA